MISLSRRFELDEYENPKQNNAYLSDAQNVMVNHVSFMNECPLYLDLFQLMRARYALYYVEQNENMRQLLLITS